MDREQKTKLTRILIAAALMIVFALLPVEGLTRFLLFMIPYFLVGYDILWEAICGIAHGEVLDENFLMAVATVGAILLGQYTEAVAVMLFDQVGEFFEDFAVDRSRQNITELMDIRPDYANVERDGELVRVDPNEVEVGCEIVVQPGEKVPIDGVVTDGISTLNTSALTGESLPRDVEPGDEVTSGCVNLNGVLRIRTTKVFGESTVSKILELVENASSRKARSEDFITRFAHYYTPIVCALALVLAVVPPLLRLALGLPPMWNDWIYRALTSLIISCPCALVISIPLSFFAGIGGASRAGILVKGSNFLEALAKTGCVAFDKTGTLTQGVFEVRAVYAEDVSEEELLRFAAHAECASSHPISGSLTRAYGQPIDRSRVTEIEEIGGNGVRARVDGRSVAVGNAKLMRRLDIEPPECEEIGTAVYVALDGAAAGYFVIADVVKPQAAEAIADLRRAGVERTAMLTGDARRVAEATAEELGIDDVYSDLLPADKVAQVEALMERGNEKKTLAFVGDGINDAPVLTRADVGIAMGALGSDAAIEAADVVLMDDDPQKVAKAVRIAKKCLRIVYENTYFAIIVKVVCLILAALGIAGMWVAIFADVGVMVIAVLNAMRALAVKRL